MHTACHNVYTLTAHVTGFRRVLVTLHALVYERNLFCKNSELIGLIFFFPIVSADEK